MCFPGRDYTWIRNFGKDAVYRIEVSFGEQSREIRSCEGSYNWKILRELFRERIKIRRKKKLSPLTLAGIN